MMQSRKIWLLSILSVVWAVAVALASPSTRAVESLPEQGGIGGMQLPALEHRPDGRTVFPLMIREARSPSWVVIESVNVISVNLVNVYLNMESVQDPAHFTLTRRGAAEPEVIEAVSVRRRALSVPNRTHALIVGTHVFLVLKEPLAPGVEYTLNIARGAGLPESKAALRFEPKANVSENIRVNQVGYLTDRPKYAIVGQYMGTRGALPLEIEDFALIDARTGEERHVGKAVLVDDFDPETGQKIYRLDFSEVRDEGFYRVYVPEIGVSYPFRIAQDALNPAGALLLRGLITQRSAYDGLTPDYTRFARVAGHLDDAYVVPASESVFTPRNPPHYTSDYDVVKHLPTARGHHDAGDYGKYTVNGARFVHYLLEMLAVAPDTVGSDNLSTPFSGNGIPDVLEEAKWELDWLENMQDPTDGGVFSIIKPAERFGYETNMPMPYSGRWIYPKDTVPTAAYAAALAHAARHPMMQEHFPEDAARYLEKAKRAWAWLEENHRFVHFHHYGEAFGDADDRVWAAVELYLATGEEKYHNYFLVNHRPHEKLWGWKHMFEAWGNASRSYILDNTREKFPGALRASEQALKQAADEFVYNSRYRRRYGFSMEDEPVRLISYGWYFPAAAHAYELIVAYRAFGDDRYLDAALANINYELGANPQSYSQITGIGSNRIMDVVDQLHLYGNVDEPRVGFPTGAGSSEMYRLGKYGDEPIEATYPENYPALNRLYSGWNVRSEITVDHWARMLGSYLYFFSDKGSQNQRPWVEVTHTRIGEGDDRTVLLEAQAGDPDGEIVSIYWDLGDGTWGLGESIVHTFGNRRAYTVFARVIDNDGGVGFTTVRVEF